MTKDDLPLQKTKKLIGALLRMPPKPHSEMKLKVKPKQAPINKLRKPKK